MGQSDGSNQRASPFPRAAPLGLAGALHELLCRTCSNWLVGILAQKANKTRSLILIACLCIRPFPQQIRPSESQAVLLCCSSCTSCPLRPLLFPSVSKKLGRNAASLIHLCASTSSFRNRCPHFPGSQDRVRVFQFGHFLFGTHTKTKQRSFVPPREAYRVAAYKLNNFETARSGALAHASI